MKRLFPAQGFALCILALLAAPAFAAQGDCGARQTSAALAAVDMEVNLLGSGLYPEGVRNVTMHDVSNIFIGYLNSVQPCNDATATLKQNAISNIYAQVINNPDQRNYSLGTALRIVTSFRDSVAVLDQAANQDLQAVLGTCTQRN